MDFDGIVSSIVENVPGAVASVIMANDGVPLAMHTKGEGSVDVQTLAIEYTAIISEIKKATEVLEAGAFEELTVRSSGLVFIIRLINNEFFIATAINPEGYCGKGRYLMRVAAPKVAAEV